LFNAFCRGRNVGGTPAAGLGLATCQTLRRNCHRGKIKVESKVGQGTTITVRLPIFDEPSNSRGQVPSVHDPPRKTGGRRTANRSAPGMFMKKFS